MISKIFFCFVRFMTNNEIGRRIEDWEKYKAFDSLEQLLSFLPSERISADKALQHQFFTGTKNASVNDCIEKMEVEWWLIYVKCMTPEIFIPKDVITHLSDDQFAIFIIDLSKFESKQKWDFFWINIYSSAFAPKENFCMCYLNSI